MKPDDRVTVARLRGTARRHVCEHSPKKAALTELVDIASEDGPLRVDLLEAAGGGELAGWQHSHTTYWAGRDAALLLVHAGADPEHVKAIADETRDHLNSTNRPGIGGPTRRATSPALAPDRRRPTARGVVPGSA